MQNLFPYDPIAELIILLAQRAEDWLDQFGFSFQQDLNPFECFFNLLNDLRLSGHRPKRLLEFALKEL